MSNKLNRKELEILRKQRALYSEISKHKEKPPPPTASAAAAPSKTIPNDSKPASLSELLGGKPHPRKQQQPTTTTKPLQFIQSMAIPKDIVDLTADDSPEKMTIHTKETSIVIDKPFGKISYKPMPPPPPPLSIQHKQQGNGVSTNIKRPSNRKRKQMDAAIDAARKRIKDASTIMEQKQQLSNDTVSSKSIISTTTMDPTKKNSGGLASLLNQAGITKKQLHTKASAQISWVEEEDREGSLLEVEDYFKCMRSWDFLNDWNRERVGTMERGKPLLNQEPSNQMKEGDEEEMKTTNSQVLPDIFTSRKQYQTLWAPLCLQEAKAQILSDASSSLPWKNANESRESGTGTKKRGNIYSPVPVVVRPKAQNSNVYSESLNIQIESDMMVQGMTFGAGDIIVLACKESYFSDASKGKLKISKASSSCIVGNVEHSRRALDGLKMIVSRQCWFRLCKDKVEMKMYLLNLGSSVTNLREFTALCRVNSIPLLPYILCRKLTRATDNLDVLSNAICGNISASRKHDHLQTIGGKTALGEGFMKYASSKFNDSQLGAISAAAREYGEGGFTLVKGPPGM
jgi:senataxin